MDWLVLVPVVSSQQQSRLIISKINGLSVVSAILLDGTEIHIFCFFL